MLPFLCEITLAAVVSYQFAILLMQNQKLVRNYATDRVETQDIANATRSMTGHLDQSSYAAGHPPTMRRHPRSLCPDPNRRK